MKPSVKTYLKVLLNLGIAVGIVLLLIFLAPKLIMFFLPFIIGWIIALIANPLVRFFEVKLKIKRKAGTAFVIIAVIALVILAGYLIGVKVTEEVVGLLNELPQMWDSIEKEFKEIGENLSVIYNSFPEGVRTALTSVGAQMDVYVGDLVSKVSTPTIEAVGNFARHLPTTIIGIIMCLLSSYFFVAERDYITKGIKTHMPESLTYRYNMMARSLKKAVGGYFKAQFKIEICMYILLVIGLEILHVQYSLLIAFGMAILDFLPFFGTGAVLLPWAIIKILSADYKMAVGLLIIWCVGQLARQIIQPKIVGDSIGMPSIPTLFLLFIGYKLGGVIGMIIAVPIGIIIANMYQEGIFDTTKNSLKILLAGINNFRRLDDKDMCTVEEYEAYQKRQLERQQAEKQEEAKNEGHGL